MKSQYALVLRLLSLLAKYGHCHSSLAFRYSKQEKNTSSDIVEIWKLKHFIYVDFADI